MINIKFESNGLLTPKMTLSVKDQLYEINNKKWLQFLSLMAYQRILNINNGLVSLEELPNLLAFHKTQPKSIGNYLHKSCYRFDHKLANILNRLVNLTTTGPFCLLIDASLISTDIEKLTKYLKWVTVKSLNPNLSHDLIFQLAESYDYNHSMNSAMQLFSIFLNRYMKDSGVPVFNKGIAYARLAGCELITKHNNFDFNGMKNKALSLIPKIESSLEKKTLQSYVLMMETYNNFSGTNPKTSYQKNKFTETKDLLLSISNRNEYMLRMLAYVHINEMQSKAMMASSVEKRDLVKIKNFLSSTGDELLIEFAELKFDLLNCRVKNSTPTEELVKRVEASFGINPGVSSFKNGLILMDILIKHKTYDHALDFGNNLLIRHAPLHEYDIYNKVIARVEVLKSKITKH